MLRVAKGASILIYDATYADEDMRFADSAAIRRLVLCNHALSRTNAGLNQITRVRR